MRVDGVEGGREETGTHLCIRDRGRRRRHVGSGWVYRVGGLVRKEVRNTGGKRMRGMYNTPTRAYQGRAIVYTIQYFPHISSEILSHCPGHTSPCSKRTRANEVE